MKKYLGVKVIDAEPMCEGLFEIRNENCEWSGDRKREGYKVVYEDGYTSWSPKDVFEKAYKTFDENKLSVDIKVYLNASVWDFVSCDNTCGDS